MLVSKIHRLQDGYDKMTACFIQDDGNKIQQKAHLVFVKHDTRPFYTNASEAGGYIALDRPLLFHVHAN